MYDHSTITFDQIKHFEQDAFLQSHSIRSVGQAVVGINGDLQFQI